MEVVIFENGRKKQLGEIKDVSGDVMLEEMKGSMKLWSSNLKNE